MKFNIKKMCFGLLCLFSFIAASHAAPLPLHFINTGSSVEAGKHFVAMDVGLNPKRLSYKTVPFSLAYAFGFKKWDLGLSASYALSYAYQVSLISKYHVFSKNTFNLGVAGAAGAAHIGMLIPVPFLSAFLVGSSRWGAYEAALFLGVSHLLIGQKVSGGSTADQKNKNLEGEKFFRWSAVQVGTSHTYHWTSDFFTTLVLRTKLKKVQNFALSLQARHLF